MKTKIIYISGNEVFEMADIRAAFEEVRTTLNLDKDTVLFGVPVDNDDAGLMKSDEIKIPEPDVVPHEIIEPAETMNDAVQDDDVVVSDKTIIDESVKKRGRARKVKTVDKDEKSEPTPVQENTDEKIVPILSVLSSNDEPDVDIKAETEQIIPDSESDIDDVEIIEDIVQETEIDDESDDANVIEDGAYSENTKDSEDTEHDLEKLLSAMKPLQEDILEANVNSAQQPVENDDDDEDIDATLEQLATEFVQTQDKIASESKSSGRGRIGKLRNILPFKQSKHKDQGLGDLFGWAGVAANDEDFSVPGFFTKTSPKE